MPAYSSNCGLATYPSINTYTGSESPSALAADASMKLYTIFPHPLSSPPECMANNDTGCRPWCDLADQTIVWPRTLTTPIPLRWKIWSTPVSFWWCYPSQCIAASSNIWCYNLCQVICPWSDGPATHALHLTPRISFLALIPLPYLIHSSLHSLFHVEFLCFQ